MRNVYAGNYREDWEALSLEVKERAGWRCIRCHHPFAPDTGSPLFCDSGCDLGRGIHRRVRAGEFDRAGRITAATLAWLSAINYGVHHFDGDKSNNRWWNLMAMCNSCHLKTQSSVIPERPWILEHSEWAKPYIGGFYAWWFAKREPTREEVERDIDLFLALGQPWFFPDRADQVRAFITHGFLADTVAATRPQVLEFRTGPPEPIVDFRPSGPDIGGVKNPASE